MYDVTLLKKSVECREAHNLTQAELANILGVTRKSLYRWITGKVKLRGSRLKVLQYIEEIKTPEEIKRQ